MKTPAAKAGLLEKFEGEAAKVEAQYERGIITDDERRQQEIEIWTEATNEVTRGHGGAMLVRTRSTRSR